MGRVGLSQEAVASSIRLVMNLKRMNAQLTVSGQVELQAQEWVRDPCGSHHHLLDGLFEGHWG